MTTRSQLEAKIADALGRLSPEDMQRVAEDYARIRYPKRFPRFDFRAFSGEGRSRPGWPDAWICVDGRIDGIEATVNKEKSGVLRHLREDLEKAKRHRPPLSGLIVVSGAPSVNLDASEIAVWRRRFAAEAGIDADHIELVFGSSLVSEFARPEFARTRIEILRLPDRPKHFKLVEAMRGPDEERLDSAFIPSAKDYAAGRVHRPKVADEVVMHLEQEGRVLVRGIGASGKTVLAWLLALEVTERRRPAYYLNLANSSPDFPNTLIEDLNQFGHTSSLFVLDNCHLDEPTAKEIALAWEKIYLRQRPQLLMVGRELRAARGSAIDGLNIPVVTLRARKAELLGVYRRLVARHTGGTLPPDPPSKVLDDWLRIFGGDPGAPETTSDLIAFSAAVLSRMRYLLRQDWTLTASNAIDEMREVYLDQLSECEVRNLVRLCACQEIEVDLSEDALPDHYGRLRKSTRQLGLVFRYHADTAGQHVRYRLAHAALTDLILAAAPGPIDKASERQSVALSDPHVGTVIIRRLSQVGLRDEGIDVAKRMISRPDCLLNMTSMLSVHSFFRQLDWVEVPIPPRLANSLASGVNLKALTDKALKTPLGDLVNFLDYAGRTGPLRPVFSALTKELAKPENLKALTDQALKTPPNFLVNFFDYAGRTGPLRPVFSALTKELVKPENLNHLAMVLERQALSAVVAILKSGVPTDLWDAILAEIDVGQWNEARRLENSPSIEALGTFRRIVTEKGRPELAVSSALRIIASSTPENWARPGIGLHHMYFILRLGREATRTDIESFLDRVAVRGWVSELLELTSTGPLAGTLLALATTLEPDLRRWFVLEALGKRVERELMRLRTSDTESRARALSLLGSAAALGVSIPTLGTNWPDTEELAELLELRAPVDSRPTIGYLQIQLWLGLYEMARLRADSVAVPPHLANQILDLWEATQAGEAGKTLPPHALALNANMISWLRRCKVEGWRLISPAKAML